jgi:hypothetical protein
MARTRVMATGQKMGDRSETNVLDRAAFRIDPPRSVPPKVCFRRSSGVDPSSTDALWLDEDQRVKIW